MRRQGLRSLVLGFAVAVALGALVASPAHSQPTPLPTDTAITPPASSIPSSVTTFSGKWVGVWGDKLAGTLVVQKIYSADSKGAHKAEGIYSWGSAPSWRISPGFRLFEGQIQDGKLQFEIVMADLTYALSNNPDVLEGTYRIRSSISMGSFTRVKE